MICLIFRNGIFQPLFFWKGCLQVNELNAICYESSVYTISAEKQRPGHAFQGELEPIKRKN